MTEGNVALCVDLDGTLIRCDVLVESVVKLLKQQPLLFFLLPLWLLQGKAFFKKQVADRVDLDITGLPFDPRFLDFLQSERNKGRTLVLATACHEKYAQQIATHLNLFDAVLASDGLCNLSGRRKLERFLSSFGSKRFDYAANGKIDLCIWSHARDAIVVNPEPGVLRALRRSRQNFRLMNDRLPSLLPTLIRALRLHQWLKNTLVFLPLLTAHLYTDVDSLWQAMVAFIAFGLCASASYILNDLLDLEADRQHPRKRNRPFASGDLPAVWGIALIPLLLASAFSLALLLPIAFVLVLTIYLGLTSAYSLHLKRIEMLDVIVLAGLYTLRVIAGTAAIGIGVSFWLLAFSMFIFLSLALLKRFTELQLMLASAKDKVAGRGYLVGDIELVRSFGAASGYCSVLVLALYIKSPEINLLYTHPELIWLICPLGLYWIGHLWMQAQRGMMHDDPLVFALRDRVSQLVVLIGILIAVLAV